MPPPHDDSTATYTGGVADTPVSKAATAALLTLVLGLALATRLHHLNTTSFWHDELQSACWAQRYTLAQLFKLGPPPLHTATLRVLSGFGRRPSQMLYRLESVAFGVLSVYWLYRLGRRLHSRSYGLAVSALLAVSAFHIWHSQQARYYVLVMLLTVVMIEQCVAWLQTDRWRNAIAAAAAAAGMVLSHYYAAIVLPGLVVFLLIARLAHPRATLRRLPRLMLQLTAAICVCAALMATNIGAMRHFTDFYAQNLRGDRPRPDASVLTRSLPPFPTPAQCAARLGAWFGGDAHFGGISHQRRTEARILFALFTAGVILGACFQRTRRAGVLCGVGVYTAIYAQACIGSGVFYPRYVCALLPLYLLGVVNGCAAIGALLSSVTRLVARLMPGIERCSVCCRLDELMLLAGAAAVAIVMFQPAARADAYARSRLDADWRAVGEFVHSNAAHRIVLLAPHRRNSKCLYMYLVGVAGNDVDYVAERELLVQRGVSDVQAAPFSLWLQDSDFSEVRDDTNVFVGVIHPYHLAGTRIACSNYTQAFALLASVDPRLSEDARQRRMVLRRLPPCRSFDVGTADARPYLVRGWGHDEQAGGVSYAWSCDEEAAIAVARCEGPTFDLALRAWSQQRRRIDLYANRQYVTNVTLDTELREYRLGDLPNPLTNRGLNFLTFVPHNLRRRDYEEFEHDHRQLGLALDQLRLMTATARTVAADGCINIDANDTR